MATKRTAAYKNVKPTLIQFMKRNRVNAVASKKFLSLTRTFIGAMS